MIKKLLFDELSPLFEPFIYIKRSFYQDRLGTNIGKIQKKDTFAGMLAPTCAGPPPACRKCSSSCFSYVRAGSVLVKWVQVLGSNGA
jgi:hypothetical protein